MAAFTFEDSPRRMLWREFKKSRKLRRWESSPLLKLMPHGRVLFECDHCHFVNLFGTLCLWCAHSCTPQPSLGPEVRRRASQPHLLNDRQKEQLRRMDAPRQASPTGCMSVPEQRQLHFADLEAPEERRKRHRDAKVFSVEVVEKDEANETAEMYVQALAGSDPSLLTGPRLIPSIYIHPYAPQHDDNTTETSARTLSPTRTLRRKQRQSVLRQRSSCSLRRKAMLGSTATPSHKRSHSDLNHVTRTLAHRASRSRGPIPLSIPAPLSALGRGKVGNGKENDVPLGHPNRPLYTAIRKNMSRPTTPSPSPTRPSSPAHSPPLADAYERGTRSLDLPTPPRLDRLLSSTSGYPLSFSTMPCEGFSLSGEIEMRMALARSQTDEGVTPPYQFRQRQQRPRDTASPPSKKVDAADTIKLKVKKLRKSLKDLITIRI